MAAGVVRGERDKTVAAATGYAEGSTRRLLSGGTPLTGNFIKAVCIKFNIRWKWVKDGEEPMLARLGESPYPDLVQKDDSKDTGSGIGLSGAKAPAIAQPIAGLSYPYKIAGHEASVPRIAGADLRDGKAPAIAQPIAGGRHYAIAGDLAGDKVSLEDLVEIIKLYFMDRGKEKSLGLFAAMAFLSVVSLPDHEMIDLVYQLRKLKDGDSDKLATAAADERFERSGIKPTTRLKLERIPVEPEE